MKQIKNQKPDITLFFPVYNDEHTVRRVTEKAISVLESVANKYEIIIINDGSPDKSGEIADQLSLTYPKVKVIHHEKNLGYGATILTGFANAKFPWICLTDGDDEYDVDDLRKLIKLKDYYDLIITFRYVKMYSGFRIFISWFYNKLFRFLFKTRYRDISTGLRLVRKEIVDEVELLSMSPFIGAELVIKIMLKGYRIGEVGIQTFPREFGKGSSTSFKNIIRTLVDMYKTYRAIFSTNFDLPANRIRMK